MAWIIGRRSLLVLTSVASFGGSLVYYRKNNNHRADNRQDDVPNDPPPKSELATAVGMQRLSVDDKLAAFDPVADSTWLASWVGEGNIFNVPRFSSAYMANKGVGYCSLGFRRSEMVPQQNWIFAFLGEGFKGWEASGFTLEAVIPTIVALLGLARSKNASHPENPSPIPEPSISSEQIDVSMKRAFQDVDHGLVDQAQDMIVSSPSKVLNLVQLSAAVSGCTGMLAVYDESSRILKVANVGDARAVLGRKKNREDGTPYFEVHVLSSEHTSSNPSELARFQESHSDTDINVLQKYAERDITRAFGLAMCKWSQEVQNRIHRDYLGESPLMDLVPPDLENQQPPYLNAEPDIRTIDVQPQDFLIIASKGVWESLSNEDAVGLVGMWLTRKNYNLLAPISNPSPEDFCDQDMLPVTFPEGWEDTTTWYQKMKIEKKFICIDNNAAIHLVRNALGGANRAFTDGVLRLSYPLSANSRGELAVIVLQFE